MIRIIIVGIEAVLFCIITLPVYLAVQVIGIFAPQRRDYICLRMIQWLFRVFILTAGVDLTVIGEENIPKDTPVLYVGNHRGFFDIIISYSRCRGLTGYVSKESLGKVPFLGMWMRALHCEFLDRNDIRKGLNSIIACIDRVKKGISVAIYPEGTRSRGKDELDMLPFHEGSFKIAAKTGCPVIPMAITHTSEIFEDHLPFIRPARVTLEYGKPIYMSEFDKDTQKKFGVYMRGEILEMLKKNE